MKRAAALLIALFGAGCSTHHTALKLNPDSPAVIYAIPESEAFAMARHAIRSSTSSYADYTRIDEQTNQFRGYSVLSENLIAYRFRQQLYVIPVAGTAVSGEEVVGFRFEIGDRGPLVIKGAPFQGAIQDRLLANTLQASLDATGTATTVTNLRLRPYGEGRDR